MQIVLGEIHIIFTNIIKKIQNAMLFSYLSLQYDKLCGLMMIIKISSIKISMTCVVSSHINDSTNIILFD